MKNSEIEKCFLSRNTWKIGTSFGTLARQLKNWHVFWPIRTPSSKVGRPLARWDVKLKSWLAFDTLARQVEKLRRRHVYWHAGALARVHVDHAGRYDTHGTRFSKLFLKNWRPISLLNVNLKMISKLHSEKLKEVLLYLNSSQQTIYVKNRHIGESGKIISDIIGVTQIKIIKGFFSYNGHWKSFWFIRS